MTMWTPRLGPLMILTVTLSLISGCTALSGWIAPGQRLTFPRQPLRADESGRWYDVDGNGVSDFAILSREDGTLDVLAYSDAPNGETDRVYRLSDYQRSAVPHLILLMDSLPFRIVSERWAAGDWRWFYQPRKVIAPFPSLSEVTFGAMLHAPPLAGNIERYYDKRTGEIENLWVARAFGYQHPWQRRVDSKLNTYLEVGMSYLNPRPWFHAELASAKSAVDIADKSVVIAYIVSSSAMVSRYGTEGLRECLDSIEQLCMQLIYERQGAIKITIISDHGHNLHSSRNFLVAERLAQFGFHPTDNIIDKARDVIPEIDGLVTYFGVHTARPAAVADAMLGCAEVELAVYQNKDVIVVRDATNSAVIEFRQDWFRYRMVSGDPLHYASLLECMRRDGVLDAEGFAPDGAWFRATVDAEFPDGLRRLWDAFHGQVVNPPQVMFTLKDGFCAGLPAMESWIEMQSTHGGLNQINSDAVVLTTTGALPEPMRSRDVIPTVEPRITLTIDR